MIQLLFHLCSSTLFIHSHIIEGNEVVHSHLFAGPVSEHSHTSSSADSIARSTFGEAIAATIVTLDDLRFSALNITIFDVQLAKIAYVAHHSLRAPPAVA